MSKNSKNNNSRLDKKLAEGTYGLSSLTTEVIPDSDLAPSKDVSTNSFNGFFSSYTNSLMRVIYRIDSYSVQNLIDALLAARIKEKQIFVIGNGGSAANASHMAADLAKDRFQRRDLLFKIQSLVDNTPLITATANDYGYKNIFVEPLKRLMNPGDIVIAISSSGNSENVVRAIEYANNNGGESFSLVGFGGGRLGEISKNVIDIPCKKGEYGFHEDICSIIYHMVIDYIVEHDKNNLKTEEEIRTSSSGNLSVKLDS